MITVQKLAGPAPGGESADSPFFYELQGGFMCGIIGNEVLPYMSIVVGICGTNFCTFFADTRLTQIGQSNTYAYSDGFHKISKINDRVLFGASGLFMPGEQIVDAIQKCPDLRTASVKVVRRAILQYLKSHQYKLTTPRCYMIGGREQDGGFVITQIQYDACLHKISEKHYRPTPPQTDYGIACSLPESFAPHRNQFLDNIVVIVNSCKAHNELKAKVEVYLHKVSPLDETVGPDIESVTIL